MVDPVFTLNVDFQLGTDPAQGFYDISHYDTGTPPAVYQAAASTHSSDIGHYIRFQDGVHVHRGSSSITDTSFRAESGTMSCTLDNRDRRFDPLFSTGPYTVQGYNRLEPGVGLQLKVTALAQTFTIFTGFADAWPQTYPAHHRDQTCLLKATDATYKLANAQLPPTYTRPSEVTGARITAIMQEIDPYGDIPRALATGQTVLPVLARGTTSAWSLVQDVNDVEWGDLYVAVDGTITFRDREAKLTDTRSLVSQATFGDGGGVEIPFFDVTMADTLIVNDVTIVYNDTGSTANAVDAVSILKPSGRRSHNKALPFQDAHEAQSYAAWIVHIYGEQRARFSSLQLKPLHSTALLAQVVRELGDRITISITPSGGGGRITRDCWIRGIQHDFQANDWTMTFTLEDATGVGTVARYDFNQYDDGSIYSF